VRRYPQWVLAVAVLMWGGAAAAATWVASRIGDRVAGLIVALALACSVGVRRAPRPSPAPGTRQ
jgi:hypothetical protein